MMLMRIVVAMTGASGIMYGVRILESLKGKAETALIMSDAARKILEIETDLRTDEIRALADRVHENDEMDAPIASGSHTFDAMIVAPCSMKTLSGIAVGYADTLITRAADVCLKEERRLILVPREAPLSLIHIENLLRVKQAGASILPASPAFYPRPEVLDDIYNFIAGRALDLLGIEHNLYKRWGPEE